VGSNGDGSVQDIPADLMRSRQFRVLLALAAFIGIGVSVAAWAFLELVHVIQTGLFEDLPDGLGYAKAPGWWPLPWLALAGLLTAVAILKLPGRGGHVPVDGLKVGGAPIRAVDLPGVLLAAFATLGLGIVLGPEAPLIALGTGLGALAMRQLRKDAPEGAVRLMGAAGSFAAVSTIFGSPLIGTVLIVEAVGLSSAIPPYVLLPGLLSAGVGSLVFVGMGAWTGLSTSAWQLSPFPLSAFDAPTWSDFAWTVVLALAAAVVVFAIVRMARWTKRLVERRLLLLTIVAGLAIGCCAIAFAQLTGEPTDGVLFSGQEAFAALFKSSSSISLATLALLLCFKGIAWSISLGNFRGGPTFPALFLGVVAGLLAGHLPGYGQDQAIAVLSAAACVSILRLPLSSAIIASLLCARAGLGITPLVLAAVVVAYLASEALTAYADSHPVQGEAGPRVDGASSQPSGTLATTDTASTPT
jgi:H+/Cl- antiporter ClcA